MAKTKKRADGLIERCRVIDGKTRHFYGRTAKEVQAKLDAALIEASTRRDRGDPFCEVAEAFWRAKEPCIKYGSRRGYRHKVELAKGWFEGQGMREITGTDINRELMHMAAQGYAYKSIAGQKSVLSKAVLEADFTAHQLRHEFASVLVECQISPQVAKELMGHADILTTQRWYAEAKASAVDEAARILNAHFTA